MSSQAGCLGRAGACVQTSIHALTPLVRAGGVRVVSPRVDLFVGPCAMWYRCLQGFIFSVPPSLKYRKRAARVRRWYGEGMGSISSFFLRRACVEVHRGAFLLEIKSPARRFLAGLEKV